MVRKALLLPTLALSLPASAKDLVVYQGENKSVAISRVVVAIDGDLEQLDSADLGQALTEASPGLAGPGSFQPCTAEGPSTLEEFNAAFAKASEEVQFMDYGAAASSFEQAINTLHCLNEPVSSNKLSELYFLQGIAHLEQNDKPAAWESFRQARLMNPSVEWNEEFAPQGKPTFAAAVAELNATETESLFLVPPPTEGQIWLDGQPVPPGTLHMEVHPGVHLVQILGDELQTALVTIEAGPDSALILSPNVPSDFLDWSHSEDPLQQAAVRASMGILEGDYDHVYVSTPDGIWSTVRGATSWTEVQTGANTVALTTPIETAPIPKANRGRTVPLLLIGTGAGLTVTGSLMAMRSYRNGMDIRDQLLDENDQIDASLGANQYNELRDQYTAVGKELTRRWLYTAGGAAIMAGGAVGLLQLRAQPLMGDHGNMGMYLELTGVIR